MRLNKIIWAVALLLGVVACEKPEVGYLSDHIFYNTNPLVVAKGVTTYSSVIVANGSTSPLHVKLLAVKNEAGDDVTDEFTMTRSIVTFNKTITYQDSTLAMLEAAMDDSLVTPFQINEIGGRLEFSAATSYLAEGNYNIDIWVSNEKGEYEIDDACEIQLVGQDQTYAMNYKRVTTDGGLYETSGDYIKVDVEYVGGGTDSKCIYKFVDKNGNFFNPAAGEVTRRASTYPFFDDWNPWYELELTDTAFVQQMPDYQGIQFPYFTTLKVGGNDWNDQSARYDWKIKKGNIVGLNEDLLGLISFQYMSRGTFIITTTLPAFERASN